MKKHAGNVMADLLVGYGVTAVFGVPGGQTLPLYYGIMDNTPKIKHILMRDETNAAFAADAYARISGRIGVCDGTAGCGSIKFTPALAEAYNASSPILAISAEMSAEALSVRYRGCGAQLTDVKAVVTPVTKWAARLPATNSVAELTEMAVRMALNGRPGPVYIECPWDLFDKEYAGLEYSADPQLASFPPYRSTPPQADVDAALQLLQNSKRPVILAGGGAWFSGAKEEITKLAETLGIPVATSLSGKGIVDETSDLSLGVVGALGGNAFSEKTVLDADVVFAIGFKFSSNATFNWKIPLAGQKMIHLDIDGIEIGKMSKVACGLNGDVKATVSRMLEMLAGAAPRPVPGWLVDGKRQWKHNRESSVRKETPIMPQHVVSVLNDICDGNTILACDASFSCGWAGSYFDVYGNRRTLFPRGMSGLGYGLPSGIGASVARPDAPVVVLTGDGGFNYCLGELQTIQEQNLNVKVVVLNNKTLGWIKWYQAAVWNGRFTEVDTNRYDYAGVGKSLGCGGRTLSDPETLANDLRKAFAEPGPAVIDIITTETEACKFNDNQAAVRCILEDHQTKV